MRSAFLAFEDPVLNLHILLLLVAHLGQGVPAALCFLWVQVFQVVRLSPVVLDVPGRDAQVGPQILYFPDVFPL